MILKKIGQSLLVIGVICLVIVPLFTSILYQTWVYKTLKQRTEQLQIKLPTLLEDQAYIQRNFPLLEKKESSDAGPFLNPLLKWYGHPTDGEDAGQSAGEKITRYRKKFPFQGSNPILLSNQIGAESLKSLSDWKKVGTQNLNFHWMEELSRFDYWDISENSPNAPEGETSSLDSILNHFEPNPLPLVTWAVLRLAQGVQKQDLLSAHQEVQHLAQLMLSTESHLMAPLAIMILEKEKALYDLLTDENSPLAKNWQPISTEALKRVSRYLDQLRFFLNPVVSRELFQSVMNGDTGFGICSSLRYNLEFYLQAFPYLQDRSPENSQFLNEALLTNKNCRLKRFREVFQSFAKNPAEFYHQKKEPSELMKDFLSEINNKNIVLKLMWPILKSRIIEYELFNQFFIGFDSP